MTTPYWIQDAIFYQIFPDRFANGDPTNDPPNIHQWDSTPTHKNFMGGDLRGVIQRFDYLLDLGINAIYFNPIFQAATNHRFDTVDYFRIDPKLGDLADFKVLVDVAHRNGVRVILDGVFNHCGRGFFAFSDVLANEMDSPYKDWFHIRAFPLDAYSPGDAKNYLSWWGHKDLPKFNTDNPEVRKYLLKVAGYWIEQGADGWRLDVPNEIDDDYFWSDFRQVVKGINRDAYLLGEIWDGDPRWLGNGHFDGLMHYPIRDALIEFIQTRELSSQGFAERIENNIDRYAREHVNAMYVCLGTHDTDRVLTLFDGKTRKLKLALAFQFAFLGAPAIYYGDEIGMQGNKDPESRGTFPWDPKKWDQDLRDYIKRLIAIRKRNPALRRGDFQTLMASDKDKAFAFARSLGDESVIVVLNASRLPITCHIPISSLGHWDGRILRDLINRDEYIVSGDRLNIQLKPWGCAWLS